MVSLLLGDYNLFSLCISTNSTRTSCVALCMPFDNQVLMIDGPVRWKNPKLILLHRFVVAADSISRARSGLCLYVFYWISRSIQSISEILISNGN